MCKGPEVDTSAQDAQQKEAQRARFAEDQRQKRIDAGLKDIGNLFDGGLYRTGTRELKAKVAPKVTSKTVTEKLPLITNEKYEAPAGGPKSATTFYVGSKAFDSENAANAFAAGKAKPKKVGVFEKSKGIEPFLTQRRSAQQDFFGGQLDSQRQDAQDGLINALAQSGLLRSSVNNEKQGDLERDFSLASAKIASDIDADIASTRSGFERERQAIEAGLRATGDRSAAMEGAQRSVSNIQDSVPDFSVLPSLFEGVTAGIGSAATGFQNADIRRRIGEGGIPLRSSGGTVVN